MIAITPNAIANMRKIIADGFLLFPLGRKVIIHQEI
jgi:hypothetical protein